MRLQLRLRLLGLLLGHGSLPQKTCGLVGGTDHLSANCIRAHKGGRLLHGGRCAHPHGLHHDNVACTHVALHWHRTLHGHATLHRDQHLRHACSITAHAVCHHGLLHLHLPVRRRRAADVACERHGRGALLAALIPVLALAVLVGVVAELALVAVHAAAAREEAAPLASTKRMPDGAHGGMQGIRRRLRHLVARQLLHLALRGLVVRARLSLLGLILRLVRPVDDALQASLVWDFRLELDLFPLWGHGGHFPLRGDRDRFPLRGLNQLQNGTARAMKPLRDWTRSQHGRHRGRGHRVGSADEEGHLLVEPGRRRQQRVAHLRAGGREP
mmetsp:Transcript_33602/g.86000  ORF Transcript_33602/g.86000 Transcript_33602/m.86000 type:complete len:328 (+) Transcript_33602:737-1720(+)